MREEDQKLRGENETRRTRRTTKERLDSPDADSGHEICEGSRGYDEVRQFHLLELGLEESLPVERRVDSLVSVPSAELTEKSKTKRGEKVST